VLETRNLLVVPLDPADVSDEYVSWLNDPETCRYLGTKFGQTRSTVRAYVEAIRPPNLLCKIVVKEGARHVGNIALNLFDPIHHRMELGIVIGVADARGRGFGREACSVLIEHAFVHLNLHKITAGTVADNVGMKKVFLDLGFIVEGTRIEHYYVDGGYHDYLLFGLTRARFTPRH
jgi:RimJ/RimL family protein N-acetyltransferase